MTEQEALDGINRLLEQHQQPRLKDLQREIVLGVWLGNSYSEIAIELEYDPDYIKQTAAQLWRLISTLVGEKVCKGNIKSILECDRCSHPLTRRETIEFITLTVEKSIAKVNQTL